MKVGLVSDIHSNIYALREVLNDLDKEGVDFILSSGDLIGYYYWPRDVIEIAMNDERFICIRGNHENILNEVIKCPSAAKNYRQKYGAGYELCQAQLSSKELNWLLSLPREATLNLGGNSFYLAHGSLGSTDRYLYPDASFEELSKNYSDSEYTIFGHTHYPFIHQCSGQFLINPGSVGQPRDRGGLASYAVINTENKVIRFKRISFNIKPIVEMVKQLDPELNYLSKIMER